jgi:uncharacterized protein
MVKEIFLNLPVKDLQASQVFFIKLGFSFNADFTDDNAACLVLGENIFAMLLTEPFFKGFTKKELADTSKTVEVITAISVDSREKVDQIVDAAMAAGGTFAKDPIDHGWMYYRSFHDLDGHIWEVTHMDMSKMPRQ